MLIPPVLVVVVFALAHDAYGGIDLFARPRHFARDVRSTLNALLHRSPASSSSSSSVLKRAAGAPAGGKCLAIAPGQFPLVAPGSGNAPSSQPGSQPAPTSSPSNPAVNTSTPSPWKVAKLYSGTDFFDGWDFFTAPDWTGGNVQYVSESVARSNGLVSVNDAGNAIMRVETTPQVATNRMSIRITTQFAYTGGLLVLDAVHMPEGCATWPAFWSNGNDWPNTGEVDIVEGVNDQKNNQATIHTRAGCTIPTTPQAVGATGAMINGFDCNIAIAGNAGCGTVLSDADGPNYGSAFNAAGGGVYAMLWDAQAIVLYWFPRSRIPADLAARAPRPDTWGTPWARWPGTTCDIMSFFKNHNAVFDTTLCGEWAGGVWGNSCAAKTGVGACTDFVRGHGEAFANAYWEVKSVAIYQNK